MDASAVVTPPYVAGPLRLEPFRALRLGPSRLGDPATARLYARPYRGVAARLAAWQRGGHLLAEEATALYVHEYTDDGLTVAGVVGGLDVARRTDTAASAAVLPHEGVHPPQVDELADRMREMALQPAPILLTLDFPAAARDVVRRVRATAPDHEFTDRGAQHHRLWAVTDPGTLSALNGAWRTRSALIADGHHRYAAYLRLQAADPGGPADLGLAMLVDQGDAPLHLGAIHRTLEGSGLDILREAAQRLGLAWHAAPHGEAVGALSSETIVVTDGTEWASLDVPIADDQCAVEFVHTTYLPALAKQARRVRYHHSVDEALQHVRQTKDVALLMPAPTSQQLTRIAARGRLLPEKATSFQPKPHPGTLMRRLTP